jgi:hypothetical protein
LALFGVAWGTHCNGALPGGYDAGQLHRNPSKKQPKQGKLRQAQSPAHHEILNVSAATSAHQTALLR